MILFTFEKHKSERAFRTTRRRFGGGGGDTLDIPEELPNLTKELARRGGS